MPASGDPEEGFDRAEVIAAGSEATKDAWERTLAELEAMAADYRDAGWTVATAAAADVAARVPDTPDPDAGFVAVLPDDAAGEVGALVGEGGVPEYDVFRRTVEGRVFFVLVLADPGMERAALLAGQYRLGDAADLAAAAREAGAVHTLLRRLDGSVVAAVRHEEPGKFFPAELWDR